MGNETKWADVAHYYAKTDHKVYLSWTNDDGVFNELTREAQFGDFKPYYLERYNLKPILTHFEDITGDQAREYYMLKTGLPSKYVNRIIIRGKSADIVSVTYLKKFPAAKVIFVDIANKATPLGGQHTTKEFLWLISNGFDMFGLIESGQAIRKEAGNG